LKDSSEPRMAERVCIVTGANSGIGKETAVKLACRMDLLF